MRFSVSIARQFLTSGSLSAGCPMFRDFRNVGVPGRGRDKAYIRPSSSRAARRRRTSSDGIMVCAEQRVDQEG